MSVKIKQLTETYDNLSAVDILDTLILKWNFIEKLQEQLKNQSKPNKELTIFTESRKEELAVQVLKVYDNAKKEMEICEGGMKTCDTAMGFHIYAARWNTLADRFEKLKRFGFNYADSLSNVCKEHALKALSRSRQSGGLFGRLKEKIKNFVTTCS